MASKKELRKEARAAIKKHAKKKPAAKRRPAVRVGNGKKKIDGRALIVAVTSGRQPEDIKAEFGFKTTQELKAHYLNAIMAAGMTPDLPNSRPKGRNGAGKKEVQTTIPDPPARSSGFQKRMADMEYHQFSDGSGGHRPKGGFKAPRKAAGNAGRQARLREKRAKAGQVQMACYVSKKTRMMVRQEAEQTGKTTGQVVEHLILKGLLGNYVTNNSVTNNAKSANKPKRPAAKKSANKRGTAPAKGKKALTRKTS